MLSKSVIVVVILSLHIRWLNCGKATVPFKVCEKYIDYLVNYTFNSTVNNSVFKDAEYTLELLHGRLKATNSSNCNDPIINLTITQTLRNDKEYVITTNYTITVGIKEVYWSNYSVLHSVRAKLEECSGEVVNPVLSTGNFESELALNISGKIIAAEFDTIDDKRKNQYCDLDLHYGCPTDSKEKTKSACLQQQTQTQTTKSEQTKRTKATIQKYSKQQQQHQFSKNDNGNISNSNQQPCNKQRQQRQQHQQQQHAISNNNKYLLIEVFVFQECSQGAYLDVNVTTCTPCPKDTYQENTGMFNCTKCEAGHTTLNTTGRRNRTACIPDIQPSPRTPSPGINVPVIASSISVLVVVIIVGVIFFVCRRKKAKEQERRNREDIVKKFMEQLPENRPTDVEANNYHITTNPHFVETEDNGISNLGHLKDDVANRNLDVPRDCITLTRVRLGRGQFGEVQQVLVRKPDEPERLCAAKMARGSRVSLDDMLEELEIHLKLEDKHENVVNLIGVCSSTGGPFYLIMEYCNNGSLIDYLKNYNEPSHDYVNTANKETLSQEWKQSRTLEICNGMKYLANHKIVHRDLAARNVLLDSNTVAKISDFGMAKDVYLKSYYKQKSEGCFPLRWMAIESIKSLQFNEKTDVWSFGVLVWEIFTHGCHPYYDIIDDQKVALYILSGKKLKRPQDCPKFLYNIMLKCWSTKSFNRPKFWELYNNLNENIQYQPKLGKATQRRFSRDIMKRFSDTKLSLKRKMSRKGSSPSEDSTEPQTSSRKPSYDRLSNDERNQLPKNVFLNPGAEKEIEMVGERRKKEEENQNVETLENEERKLEPHLGDNDCPGDTPQCSSNDETPYGSSNAKEIGSPPQNKNQDIEDTQKSTYNQQNNNSGFEMSLFTKDSNELEEGGNTLPKSDDSFQNSENNLADIVGLGSDERPKTDSDHSKTPKEGVTQTDDSTSKN
ncbi:fibroblast growth factor receptor homolog 1 [Paramuricea clavata]|uniref:Fibroblast growth factor receptor homolog 1 n=1 Tax=Paramuricea clavata TaxID=317549 RepID=A0A7D9HPK6_PARCT|nr:fibroblast growth factor receptor homolog 1 [Paramuricea clavata]